MHYGNIKTCDIANGIGVRVSLFVSGCTNQCPGCFNPETWDFQYGSEYREETQEYILHALQPDYIKGLSILGGEPFELANQRVLASLIKAVKARYPHKDIWIYTGFVFEDLLQGGCRHCEVSDEILANIDVLVDGKFIEEQKDISLRFRGSRNQRLLDIPKTLSSGTITPWSE